MNLFLIKRYGMVFWYQSDGFPEDYDEIGDYLESSSELNRLAENSRDIYLVSPGDITVIDKISRPSLGLIILLMYLEQENCCSECAE